MNRGAAPIALLALASALAACTSKEEVKPDTGVPERERTILEHTREIAGRMRDVRFRAELLAELGAVLAAAKDDANAKVLLADALAESKKITAADDREHAAERIAAAHAQAGLVDAALELAGTIKTSDTRADVMVAIARAAAASGDVDRAATIAEKIPREEQKGDAYVAAVRAAGAAGSFDVALELSKKPPRPEHRAEALAALAKAYVAAKRTKDAEKVIDSIDNGHWKGDAQGALMAAYFAADQKTRAEKLGRAIESSWIQARTYADLAVMADEDGRTKEAEKLLAKATSIADGIHDKTMMSSAYEDVAVRGLAKDRVREALELASRCPSNDARHRIYAKVAGALAKARRFAEADEVAGKITNDPIATTDAFAAIALAYADNDNDERALEAVTKVPTLSLRIAPVAKVIGSSLAHQRAVTSLMLVHLATALEAAPAPRR